jgi:hypothetical protein
MHPNQNERFTVEVTLMDDPCLWRWEIRDGVRGAIVQSSWDQEWTAYPSREEAIREAKARLHLFSQHGRGDRFGSWRFGATA